ncbi:MAG: LD-carboxypeptidase [Balneolaceae bacterium]|nr:LD-carboxypeptidase [Balneolaceae bacterium]
MPLSRKDFIKLSGLTTLSSMAGLPDALEKNIRASQRLIKPKPLQKGDTLGLVAPGSPIYKKMDFDRMLLNLEALGFKLKLGKHVRDRYGYLAGRDEDRAEDLMKSFTDPEIDGIVCIRGGWGCNRILPLLDFQQIAEHPKFFMGFSDITSLHMAIQKKTGLVTFHGPVGKSEWTPFTTQSFKEVAWKGKRATYPVPDYSSSYIINEGKTKGKLLGGNLSVLVAMIGSGYLPDFNQSILFLEDVGESVYRIDRMLTQLKLAGILDQLSGFIFGKCTDCSAGANSLSLKQVFEDHIKPLGIPAYHGAMISHEDDNVTIPIGLKAEMDANKQIFRLTEAPVQL